MRRKQLSSPYTLHPIFSIFIPFFFFAAGIQILDMIFSRLLGINILTYFLLFLTALEEALVGYLLYKEKVDEIHRIRELAFIVLILIVFRIIFISGTWTERINSLLDISFIFLCSVVILQWVAAFNIHLDLREREILLNSLQHKTSSELTRYIRKNVVLIDLAYVKIAGIKARIVIFQILTFMGLGILYLFGKSPSLPLFWLMIIQLMAGLMSFILLNKMIHEHNLLAEGIRPGSLYRKKHVYYILIIFVLIILFSLLFAKDVSIFSVSIFSPLLEWFGGLFKFKFPPSKPQQPDNRNFDALRYLSEGESLFKNNQLLRFIALFVTLFSYGILFLLAVGFLYFLFSPLFSRYFSWRIKWWKPIQFIWLKILAFLRLLRETWQDFFKWLNHPVQKNSAKSRQDRTRDWLAVQEEKKLKLSKRLQMRSFIRAFLKLTSWGAKRKVPYLTYMGPLEYGQYLMATVPPLSVAIKEALEILEECLFSHNLVEKNKVKRYYNLIKEITGSGH